MDSKNKRDILCLAIKYMLSLFLFLISVLLSKDVLDQYASKSTSFKQYEEEITVNESVTVVMNLWPLKNMDYPASIPFQSYEQWELEKDFKLAFGVTKYKSAQEKIYLSEYDNNLEISHSSIGRIKFNRFVTNWGIYYKISANIIDVKLPFYVFIQLIFDNSIPDEEIPGNEFHFSAEENSYGITMNRWFEGKRLTFTHVKGYYFTEIRPKKVIKMTNCSTSTSFYNCFHSELMNQSFETCPRRCFSITTYKNATPICKTLEEFQCAQGIADELLKNSKCLPKCLQLDYNQEISYQEDFEKMDAKRNITIAYNFPNTKMKVEEEYLIQDFVGMLGSIGGTLGLFVGFSFFGGISFTLNHLQTLIEKICKKSPNSTSQKITSVELNTKENIESNDKLFRKIMSLEEKWEIRFQKLEGRLDNLNHCN